MGKSWGRPQDILVRGCYRQPTQDEEAQEIFYKQLEEIS